jgi:proline utilization trans-activator
MHAHVFIFTDCTLSRYIHELQRKAIQGSDPYTRHDARVAQGVPLPVAQPSRPIHEAGETPRPGAQSSIVLDSEQLSTRATSEEPTLTNFLVNGSSTFMTAGNGMTFYLGTSSNWTFTQRILSMVYERVFQDRIPDMGRAIEGLGNAYDLEWDGISTSDELDSVALPTIDHAIYLINAVKFHCAQLFHVLDEDTFMPALYAFYAKSSGRGAAAKLWFVHFMIVLAFGKGFTVHKGGKNPPGIEYFMHGLRLLPSTIMLWKHPVHSVEVLTCIAFYLQCLDYRIVAHNYVSLRDFTHAA